jgi:hypothetical protein
MKGVLKMLDEWLLTNGIEYEIKTLAVRIETIRQKKYLCAHNR